MNQVTILPGMVVLIATLIAAATDLRQFKIYNLLTVPLLASGLVYHGLVGGVHQFSNGLVGIIFGCGILIPFYLMGGVGGGDVKLMAGVGAWLGGPLTFYVFVVAAVAGGIYALILILVDQRLRETWVNLQIIWHRIAAAGRYLAAEGHVEAEVNRPDRRRRLVPFGAMVYLGAILTVVWYRCGMNP